MRIVTLVALFAACVGSIQGQIQTLNQNQVQAGVGMTWIDNQRFYAFRLRPEFSFSNIGVGLDLNLEFDSSGTLRKENFNELSDYLSIIRYIRYGQEFDPVYIKLGALDYVAIGHGSIISNYNNSPSFDSRKIGFQLNLNYDKVGLQTMYGDFGEAGVVGLRPFVRPLQFTSLADLPVLNKIEVGVTYAGDFNKFARVDYYYPVSLESPPGPVTPILGGTGELHVIGADIGIPIVRGDIAGLELYADFTKIIDFGSGIATGILFRLDGLPAINVRARLERRFNGTQYLPSYFNSFYELERYNRLNSTAKSLTLRNNTAYTKGVYGDLLIRIINTFDIYGSYEKVEAVPNSGDFHLWTELAPPDAPILARLGYDKVRIKDLADLIITDDRSLLYAEIGYKPYPFLIVSMVYRWTYAPVRSGDDIVGYTTQRRVEPKLEFVYTF